MKSLTIKIMEKELNIAAILKEKPEHTKLWSDTFGVMFLTECKEDSFNVQCRDDNLVWSYLPNGTFRKYMGIMSIFPSKSMRSWGKFAWKKGDVLKVATGGDCSCIFNRFTNEDYTEFSGLFDKNINRFDYFATSDWCKVTDEKECESIIQRIETQYGGKLNLDTLKIEKPQFKDGDIVQIGDDAFVILKEIEPYKASYHYYYKDGITNFNDSINIAGQSLKLASKADQLTILSHLKKYFKKQWDAEKKAVVDLPKKCEFKPKDWCLMRFRGTNKDVWKLCQFGFINDEDKNDLGYCAIGGNWFNECIPYNDQTAHLLGTTDDWKGGE